MKSFTCSTIIVIVATVLSACTPQTSPSNTPVADVSTPTLQVLATTPAQTTLNDKVESFSSDELGICFSYPQGYTQIVGDTVEIAGPDIQGTNTKGIFWLEISDAYDRTAEKIADQDMTTASGLNIGRSTLTLGDEPAVVLDGMPGQDLQRRIYVVHGQSLYVLAFMPTRSENKAAGDQLEALYTAITNSWAWSACPAK
jgi:hypothetical protein